MGLTVSGLADELETAMAYEWNKLKGTTLSDAGEDDRRMLFLAIARGLLNYLQKQESTAMNTITLNDGAITDQLYTVKNLDLNITIDE
jgi:hypothetical protein